MDKTRKKRAPSGSPAGLEKCPTGIPGLDQITNGGLPKGRTTLICGSSGSGKTLFGMEFLVKGGIENGEPGVFMAFEERADELAGNVASLGIDLQALINGKQMIIDHVHIDRSEMEETGEYDLEALFIRLGYAIDSIGAKRVVLDTLEVLFGALTNTNILRAELRRLFQWLKDKGVTSIVTGERGERQLTRHGLEEYVSDCVILLDQRVANQIATRRLRIVKYRGSAHGSNEYPFLLDEQGVTVTPVTGISQQYAVSRDFVSTGVASLDDMLGGKGCYRGSSLLVSGTAGTGKSSIAAHFVDAACRRGERCIYFAFEESPEQIMRNMRSIGINLQPWRKKGLLDLQAMRPTSYGLEKLLAIIERTVEQFQPHMVVFDPISSLELASSFEEARTALMRLVDFLKSRQITALFNSLTGSGDPAEQSEVGISSLIDTWLLLRNMEQSGERTRLLYILKSRGMAHSNHVREFFLTDHGVDLMDVYMGPNGILTGTARAVQEMRDSAAVLSRDQKAKQARLMIDHKRKAMEARIAELKAEFEIELREMETLIAEEEGSAKSLLTGRAKAGRQGKGALGKARQRGKR